MGAPLKNVHYIICDMTASNSGQGNPNLKDSGGAVAHYRQRVYETTGHFLIFPTGCPSHAVDNESMKVLTSHTVERDELLCKKKATQSERSKYMELSNDLAKEVRRYGKLIRRFIRRCEGTKKLPPQPEYIYLTGTPTLLYAYSINPALLSSSLLSKTSVRVSVRTDTPWQHAGATH